jgi:hypothetical protein
MPEPIDIRRLLAERSRRSSPDYSPMTRALVAICLAFAKVENLSGEEFQDVISLAMRVEDRDGVDLATVAVLEEIGYCE